MSFHLDLVLRQSLKVQPNFQLYSLPSRAGETCWFLQTTVEKELHPLAIAFRWWCNMSKGINT